MVNHLDDIDIPQVTHWARFRGEEPVHPDQITIIRTHSSNFNEINRHLRTTIFQINGQYYHADHGKGKLTPTQLAQYINNFNNPTPTKKLTNHPLLLRGLLWEPTH